MMHAAAVQALTERSKAARLAAFRGYLRAEHDAGRWAGLAVETLTGVLYVLEEERP